MPPDNHDTATHNIADFLQLTFVRELSAHPISDLCNEWNFAMSVETLPAELQLKIASYLQLRELVLLRNSSRHWQAQVNKNLSFIPPARRALLLLWDDIIRSPYFLPSRTRVLPKLRPFDRTQYVDSLSRGLALPEEFELWLLEWPAKAVIGWSWPGLDGGVDGRRDHRCCDWPPVDAWWQPNGWNALTNHGAYRDAAPAVFTLSGTPEAAMTGIWLERTDGSGRYRSARPEEVYRDVAERGASMAVPVWWEYDHHPYSSCRYSLVYMLVVSEGGEQTRDHPVRYFEVDSTDVGHGSAAAMLRFYDDNDDDDDEENPESGGLWPEPGVWRQDCIISPAVSWVGWLRNLLEYLEDEYERYRADSADDETYCDMMGG